MTWNYGDVVTLRWRRKPPLDVAMPVRVVEDSDEVTMLYTMVGTPMKVEATADGTVMQRRLGSFVDRQKMTRGFADWTWTQNHTLMIQRPGSMRSTWLFWRGDTGTFNYYYVNLQAPLTRTTVGFDSADYVLDLVVKPDFSWEWKDVDEFADARTAGVMPAELLDAVQRTGDETIPIIETRGWPFDAGLETWRPDPAWEIPELPENWAEGIDLTGYTLF